MAFLKRIDDYTSHQSPNLADGVAACSLVTESQTRQDDDQDEKGRQRKDGKIGQSGTLGPDIVRIPGNRRILQ